VVVAYLIQWCAWWVCGIELTRRSFALTGRAVWWAVLAIGATTMALMIFAAFDDNADGGGEEGILDFLGDMSDTSPYASPYTPPHRLDAIFTGLGYGMSGTGFVAFVITVYETVRNSMARRTAQLADHILHVVHT
jgi:hypothetical protein